MSASQYIFAGQELNRDMYFSPSRRQEFKPRTTDNSSHLLFVHFGKYLRHISTLIVTGKEHHRLEILDKTQILISTLLKPCAFSKVSEESPQPNPNRLNLSPPPELT